MIYKLTGPEDKYADKLKDDPVRPHISNNHRFGGNSSVLALVENEQVRAMVCTKMCSRVPSSEAELLTDETDEPSVIIFYTIWSYDKGAGRELILQALEKVKQEMPTIKRYITLSPSTEMAKRFHLKNGAEIFRVNSGSVNYEYY